MTIRQQLVCVTLMLTGTIGLNLMRVEAQVNTTLTSPLPAAAVHAVR